MSIFKCINCEGNSIKFYGFFGQGNLKCKCENCGIMSSDPLKFGAKKAEIYRTNKYVSRVGPSEADSDGRERLK